MNQPVGDFVIVGIECNPAFWINFVSTGISLKITLTQEDHHSDQQQIIMSTIFFPFSIHENKEKQRKSKKPTIPIFGLIYHRMLSKICDFYQRMWLNLRRPSDDHIPAHIWNETKCVTKKFEFILRKINIRWIDKSTCEKISECQEHKITCTISPVLVSHCNIFLFCIPERNIFCLSSSGLNFTQKGIWPVWKRFFTWPKIESILQKSV